MDKQTEDGGWRTVSQAYFIMVARFMDRHNRLLAGEKPSLIPLLTGSDAETEMLRQGQQRSDQRKQRRASSLRFGPPTPAEISRVHELLYQQSGTHSGVPNEATVASTALETTKLCHPQERNLHEKIFGGYLMREAFELAFTGALLHVRAPLECVAIDDISFVHPVSIGDLLRLGGRLVYTCRRRRLLQVSVAADVLNPQDRTARPVRTNTFHFTFRPRDPTAAWIDVRPETYEEAIEWLQAQRRLEGHQ